MPILFKGGLNSRFFFSIWSYSQKKVWSDCASRFQPKVKNWGAEISHNFWGLTRLKIRSEIKPPLKRMSIKFVLTAEFLDSTKNAMEPCLSIWYFLQIHEFTKFQKVSRIPNSKLSQTFTNYIVCFLFIFFTNE